MYYIIPYLRVPVHGRPPAPLVQKGREGSFPLRHTRNGKSRIISLYNVRRWIHCQADSIHPVLVFVSGSLFQPQKNLIISDEIIFELVRSERFELSRITPLPPEDSASASSATTAYKLKYKNKLGMVRLVRLELTRSRITTPSK